MSNIADPQCSSGVESGWTTYLDDHNDNNERINLNDGSYGYRSWSRKEENDYDYDYDKDENLSMVSDASSGPPYYEAEVWRGRHVSRGGFLAGFGNKRQQQSGGGRYSGCYEDTACSSHQKNFSPPANNYPPSRHPFDFNQGYSNLEGRFESGNNPYNNVQTHVADKRASLKKPTGRSRKLV